MKKLRLYDTYTRSLRDFEALRPPQVGLYSCGKTVYNYAHIGNLRSYIFMDILRRVLEYNGYEVRHVMNITDVGHLVSDADTGEDKMEKGSRRTGLSAWQIAEIYTEAFRQDLDMLNILEPHIWCRATDHIQEQIDMIRCIEAGDFTYRTPDGIYFDTSKMSDYGYLARLNLEGQQGGARVDIAGKRNPTDFALWKFSPPGEQRQMEWDSPWGTGFPGWHIECSAMSAKYLSPYFDIHTGGEDHIMIHHPNEIAQTQACYGTNLANFWMHGYFLQVKDEETGEDGRMGSSQGNFLRLQTLIDRGYDPLAWRFFCHGAHYRSKLNFNWDALSGAATALDRLRTAVYEWGPAAETADAVYLERFLEQINDDLNMPRVLALTWDLSKSDLADGVKKATMLEFDRVLGLDLAAWTPGEEVVPQEVMVLVQQRTQARAEKRWADADLLRDQVHALGYEIDDTPQGPRVRAI
ncbi:MAG: cysteine--tRNA ligase [Candidatus Promineifilaceae bacterium]